MDRENCVGDYGGCSNRIPCAYCVKVKADFGDEIVRRLTAFRDELKAFGYTPKQLADEIKSTDLSRCKTLDEILLARSNHAQT